MAKVAKTTEESTAVMTLPTLAGYDNPCPMLMGATPVEGFDAELDEEDLIVPKLNVGQTNSRARDKQQAEYIKGLEVGDLYNSGNGDIYGESVDVIPLSMTKSWYLKLRDHENRFEHSLKTTVFSKADLQAAIEDLEPHERGIAYDQINANYLVMVLPKDATQEATLAMLTFSRSKWKHHKVLANKLKALAQMSGTPTYAWKITMVTDQESNGSNSWQVFKMQGSPERVSPALEEQMRQIRAQINPSTVRTEDDGDDF